MTIPILDLTRQYKALKADIERAICDVAESGQYILGPNVRAFESEVAEFLGVKHAIGCASGTDALLLACMALKIGEGDEVITTPFTYVATSESVIHAGATPVFADIDPDTFNFDLESVKKCITPKTKAILPVHLYGQPCDMTALKQLAKEHNLYVIEDCAQSIGSEFNGTKTGVEGDIGCFSFFPTKNLGAFGDGGLVTTNDDALAERLRMLRAHGSRERYYHEESGLNSRLDEMQAAILRIKLPHLDQWNQGRREAANRYNDLLKPYAEKVQTPVVIENCTPVFHQYTIRLKGLTGEERSTVQAKLRDHGVMAMIYYPVPQYKQQSHAFLNVSADAFPVTEKTCDEVLSLPMFPEITAEEQQYVVSALVSVLEEVTG